MISLNSESKCHVYWIRTAEHNDIFTQGYVGVTVKRPTHRFHDHKAKARTGATLPISRAIRKYGEQLIVETVLVSTQEYCYEMEGKLRSSPNTGWNVAIGGEASGTTGRHHTEETKARLSEVNSGRKLSASARANISKRQLGKTHSEDTKAKIAASMKGKTRGPYKAKSDKPY